MPAFPEPAGKTTHTPLHFRSLPHLPLAEAIRSGFRRLEQGVTALLAAMTPGHA